MNGIYRERLIRTATAGCELQRSDGSMPPGRNNTWNDPDTPVRCTSHFTVTFLHAFRWTQDERYRQAASRCLEWLCSPAARPHDATFLCRTTRRKNQCNGLIGQAWALEALLHGFSELRDQRLLDLATRVFQMHPYDSRTGLFRVREVDGAAKNLALTLNHQLIFVAQGMRLATLGNEVIQKKVDAFFSMMQATMALSAEGLIEHHVRRGTRELTRRVFDGVLWPYRRNIRQRSEGYQSFNMFALAVAHRNRPDATIWRREDMKSRLRAIHRYAANPSYLAGVKENAFALAYRLTGAELLVFQQEFRLEGATQQIRGLIDLQFEAHWDEEAGLLQRGTGDPATLSSRIYEMCYLFNGGDGRDTG